VHTPSAAPKGRGRCVAAALALALFTAFGIWWWVLESPQTGPAAGPISADPKPLASRLQGETSRIGPGYTGGVQHEYVCLKEPLHHHV